MLVIGSKALEHHGIHLRAPSCDIDLIATQKDYDDYIAMCPPDKVLIDADKKKAVQYGGIILEFDIAEMGDTNWWLVEYYVAKGLSLVYANVNTVYTLKMSHRFKKDSPHFLKTMYDIKELRKLGAEVPIYLSGDWYKSREKETYNYAHPNLNVSKDDFFKEDEVPYQYDHDSLHEAIKVGGVPAYKHIKPEDEEVMCSKEMFEACSYETKLLTVYEEAAVLSLERSLIPYPDGDPEEVFKCALMKVCTSITSGWWRDWAWEHYEEALGLAEELGFDRIVDKFQEALYAGNVLPFNESA